MFVGAPDQPPSWWSRLVGPVGVVGLTLALTCVSPAPQPSVAIKAGATAHPADAWESVLAAVAAVGPGDPCLRVVEKTANNQVRRFASAGINPTYVDVWPSGRVRLRHHHGPQREGCVDPQLARSWIAQPAASSAIEDMFERLGDGDQLEPLERPCAERYGRWCGISWPNAVHLYADGTFGCYADGVRGEADRLPPEMATALIEAIERFAEAHHALETNDPSGLRVYAMGLRREWTLAVPRAGEIRALLRRAICPVGDGDRTGSSKPSGG
jgi:hypothetical protein